MSSRPHSPGAERAADTTAVLRVVAQSRRRAALARFFRYSAPVLPAVVIGLSLLSLMRGGVMPLQWLALTASAAVLSCAAAAWWRRPSAEGIAAVLDRRLHLEDSVSAALVAACGSGAIESLVVRDAGRRLAAVDVAAAFPLRLRPAFVSAGITAGWLLLIAATADPGAAVNRRPAGRMIPSGDAGAGSMTPERGTTTEGPATARPVDANTRLAGPETQIATANDRAGLPGGVQRSPRDGENPASPSRGSGPGQPDASPRTAGGSGTAALATTAGGGSGSPGAGAGQPGSGTGGGGSGGAGIEDGAGGVNAGTLLAPTTDRALTPGSGDQPVSAPGQRRSAPAAAAWEGRVPPDLRSYVRDYFIAIRSVERR